jgi:hypothetical protein
MTDCPSESALLDSSFVFPPCTAELTEHIYPCSTPFSANRRIRTFIYCEMAPFSQAIESTFSRREDDGTAVYSGAVDPEWVIDVYVTALDT